MRIRNGRYSKRVETVLKNKHGLKELDKGRVLVKMLERFDRWAEPKDLPSGTEAKAGRLFKAINAAFGESKDD